MTKQIDDETLEQVTGGAIDLERLGGARRVMLGRLRGAVPEPPGGRGPTPEGNRPAADTPDFGRGSDD